MNAHFESSRFRYGPPSPILPEKPFVFEIIKTLCLYRKNILGNFVQEYKLSSLLTGNRKAYNNSGVYLHHIIRLKRV